MRDAIRYKSVDAVEEQVKLGASVEKAEDFNYDQGKVEEGMSDDRVVQAITRGTRKRRDWRGFS